MRAGYILENSSRNSLDSCGKTVRVYWRVIRCDPGFHRYPNMWMVISASWRMRVVFQFYISILAASPLASSGFAAIWVSGLRPIMVYICIVV